MHFLIQELDFSLKIAASFAQCIRDTIGVSQEVKNAKLYRVGPPSDSVDVVHLWGTPYEMGWAHVAIANDTVTALLDKVWLYLESQVGFS